MTTDPNVIAIHPPGGIQVTDLPPLPDVPPPPRSGVRHIPADPPVPPAGPTVTATHSVDVNPPAPPAAGVPPTPLAAPEPKWVAEALAHLARPTRKKAYAVAAAAGVAVVAFGLNAVFFRAARPAAEKPAEVAAAPPPEAKPALAEPPKPVESSAVPIVPLAAPLVPTPPADNAVKPAELPGAFNAAVPTVAPVTLAVPSIPPPVTPPVAPMTPKTDVPSAPVPLSAPPPASPPGFTSTGTAPAAEDKLVPPVKSPLPPAAEGARPADRVTDLVPPPGQFHATGTVDTAAVTTASHAEAAPTPPVPAPAVLPPIVPAPALPAPLPKPESPAAGPSTMPLPPLPSTASPPVAAPPVPKVELAKPPVTLPPVRPDAAKLGGLGVATPEVKPVTPALPPPAVTPAVPLPQDPKPQPVLVSPEPTPVPMPTPAGTPSAFTESPAAPASPNFSAAAPGTLTLTKPVDATAPTPPASAPPPPAPAPAPVADPNVRKPAYEVDLHDVQRGETFEAISRRHYGSDKHAAALQAFNGDRDLAPGTSVQLPPLAALRRMGGPAWAAAPGPRPAPAARVFTAPHDGMSLWDVALEVYGTKAEWSRIHAANPDRDPNLRYKAGDQFRLPADAPARSR